MPLVANDAQISQMFLAEKDGFSRLPAVSLVCSNSAG